MEWADYYAPKSRVIDLDGQAGILGSRFTIWFWSGLRERIWSKEHFWIGTGEAMDSQQKCIQKINKSLSRHVRYLCASERLTTGANFGIDYDFSL